MHNGPFSLGYRILTVVATMILLGCSSSNCPLDNFVSCNYFFYDMEGTPVAFSDTLTVKTLLPGYKTIYTYRQIGYATVSKEKRDSNLLKQGFTETMSEVRRDTILIGRLVNAKSFKVPMSYTNSEDTLVFSYAGISLPDTIKVKHQSYTHVEAPECGLCKFHTLESINATDRYIDHVEISNPKVNYDGNENIKIYFNGTAE